jgi:hypothetical protein
MATKIYFKSKTEIARLRNVGKFGFPASDKATTDLFECRVLLCF